ncbi:hypothetical protein OPV22_010135 [Ensete ventricosum]|uniref:Uncharacterized protein n=1 Tax=Ensete ventricosum TaxID=4639 RepID=A0AAV8R6U3_ENSVE|nr:hypothetical protein OPV22_010135 [Ensete ventricosum]
MARRRRCSVAWWCVYVHPSIALKVRRAILRLLSSLLFTLDEEILNISGSLVLPDNGCIRWFSRHGVEDGAHMDSYSLEYMKKFEEAEGC